jgi:hypothetical protein
MKEPVLRNQHVKYVQISTISSAVKSAESDKNLEQKKLLQSAMSEVLTAMLKKDPSLLKYDNIRTGKPLDFQVPRVLFQTHLTTLKDKHTKRYMLCYENECKRFDSHRLCSADCVLVISLQ